MKKMNVKEYMEFDGSNVEEIENVISDKIENLEFVLVNEEEDCTYYVMKDGSIILLSSMMTKKFKNIDEMMLTFKN